ncbi:MAG: hypothetical protein GYB65_15160 [Chloroflexi bacterium]|nr:hypothetical protein [Chloroflexota bacterium]
MSFRRDFLRTLEAGTVGLFLIQAVRYVYATLYAHASSADLLQRTVDPDVYANAPGAIEVATVQIEIIMLIALLLLPLLALIIGRWRISFPLAVLMVAAGRSVALQVTDTEIATGGLVVGGGLLYLALTIIRRPAFFPVMLLVGFSAEQVIRALGDTYDYTWRGDYMVPVTTGLELQMDILIAIAAILLILFSVLLWFDELLEARRPGYTRPERGQLNLWGGLALGGLLYLEFTVLSLPNAVARWANADYAGIVPLLIAATALPLVPEVRNQARQFASMFDSAWRGWLWVLLLCLLLVVGRRYEGPVAGVALVFAQFITVLTLWWFVQTGSPRRNITGVNVIVAVIAFVTLSVGDYFTYDYAYVRDISDPTYQNVDNVLRSFRNMGLGLALIAALLVSIPMILARRWIPWRGGRTLYTLATLVAILGTSFVGAATSGTASSPRPPANSDCLRAVSFNIHGGYSQFFEPNLEQVAQLIELNGADILLLQEVDTGRMASGGVDQVLWLARRLDMEAAFFPQNEALQGLAILSRVPIVDSEGLLLPSDGNQAAVMRVTLDPEAGLNDPAAPTSQLQVYNVWLGFWLAERDGQPVPFDEQDTKRQLDSLLNWIGTPAPDTRLILGGTFNFDFRQAPTDALYNDITTRLPNLEDPFADRRIVETVFLVNDTQWRYDYLWIRQLPRKGTMIDASEEGANTSDHRSVIVQFLRRGGEPALTCP